MKITVLSIFFACLFVFAMGSNVTRSNITQRFSRRTHLQAKGSRRVVRNVVAAADLDYEPIYDIFSFYLYSRGLYRLIRNHLPLFQGNNQFGFVMIAPTEETDYVIPNAQVRQYLTTGRLPDLGAGGVIPPNAWSNLVIAGVDRNRVSGPLDFPHHPENKIIDEMVTMDEYYEQQFGNFCPFLILLGSRLGTCYRPGTTRCANKFLNIKQKYMDETGCDDDVTNWVVYVYGDLDPEWWPVAEALYTQANIWTFVENPFGG